MGERVAAGCICPGWLIVCCPASARVRCTFEWSASALSTVAGENSHRAVLKITRARGLNHRACLRKCSQVWPIAQILPSPSCDQRPGVRRPRIEAGSPCCSGAGRGMDGGLRRRFHAAIH